MANKKDKERIIPIKTLSHEDLKKLVDESGLAIRVIEVGIGMPITTLDKCYKATPDPITGYVRTLPAKWEAPLIQFIKEKKAAKVDHKEEIKEVFKDLNIEVVEPEVLIPDQERKENWINMLHEVKAQLN